MHCFNLRVHRMTICIKVILNDFGEGEVRKWSWKGEQKRVWVWPILQSISVLPSVIMVLLFHPSLESLDPWKKKEKKGNGVLMMMTLSRFLPIVTTLFSLSIFIGFSPLSLTRFPHLSFPPSLLSFLYSPYSLSHCMGEIFSSFPTTQLSIFLTVLPSYSTCNFSQYFLIGRGDSKYYTALVINLSLLVCLPNLYVVVLKEICQKAWKTVYNSFLLQG